QPSAESLKKVVDGKVALMDGGHEQTLPGGEAEGKFCVSLSKLLHLDEVQCVQVLHAFLRRRNSERPRGSPPASEGLDLTSGALLFEVRDYHRNQRLSHLYLLHELLRIDQGPDNNLHSKAGQILGR
ncbi:unnamed protein product, partial [Laminaria digitata]